MKALAASSIAQYEHAVESLRHYASTVEQGLAVCLRESGTVPAVALNPRSAVTRGAIIFGSDQGLVGRFNESLVQFALGALAALPGETNFVWVVGERMQELVADSDLPTPVTLPVPHSVDAIAPLVTRILIDIAAARAGEIHLFHNASSGSSGYAPVSKRLLPLDALWQKNILAIPWPTKALPEVIGATASALESLIRGHLFIVLFQACAQSLASENASRLAAMQRAEDNIAKILEELNRKFRRVRQETIDEELFDVVSGYESMTSRN
jgi:F-type H+-transporting ATPase subunit gamma